MVLYSKDDEWKLFRTVKGFLSVKNVENNSKTRVDRTPQQEELNFTSSYVTLPRVSTVRNLGWVGLGWESELKGFFFFGRDRVDFAYPFFPLTEESSSNPSIMKPHALPFQNLKANIALTIVTFTFISNNTVGSKQ